MKDPNTIIRTGLVKPKWTRADYDILDEAARRRKAQEQWEKDHKKSIVCIHIYFAIKPIDVKLLQFRNLTEQQAKAIDGKAFLCEPCANLFDSTEIPQSVLYNFQAKYLHEFKNKVKSIKEI